MLYKKKITQKQAKTNCKKNNQNKANQKLNENEKTIWIV